MNYKEKILESLEEIDNNDFLKFIYSIIQSFKKNGVIKTPFLFCIKNKLPHKAIKIKIKAQNQTYIWNLYLLD